MESTFYLCIVMAFEFMLIQQSDSVPYPAHGHYIPNCRFGHIKFNGECVTSKGTHHVEEMGIYGYGLGFGIDGSEKWWLSWHHGLGRHAGRIMGFTGQPVAMQGAYKGPNGAMATTEARTHTTGLPDKKYVVENANPTLIAAALFEAGLREELIHNVIARLNFDYKLYGVMKFQASWRAVGTTTYYYSKDVVFEGKTLTKSLEFCNFEQAAPDEHYGEWIVEDFGVDCLHETYCETARREASNAMAITVNELLKSKNVLEDDSCGGFIKEMPACKYMAKFEKITAAYAAGNTGEFDK